MQWRTGGGGIESTCGGAKLVDLTYNQAVLSIPAPIDENGIRKYPIYQSVLDSNLNTIRCPIKESKHVHF